MCKSEMHYQQRADGYPFSCGGQGQLHREMPLLRERTEKRRVYDHLRDLRLDDLRDLRLDDLQFTIGITPFVICSNRDRGMIHQS